MNRQDLIKEMRASVGTKDPVVFFEKMVDLFDALFEEVGDDLIANFGNFKLLFLEPKFRILKIS